MAVQCRLEARGAQDCSDHGLELAEQIPSVREERVSVRNKKLEGGEEDWRETWAAGLLVVFGSFMSNKLTQPSEHYNYGFLKLRL